MAKNTTRTFNSRHDAKLYSDKDIRKALRRAGIDPTSVFMTYSQRGGGRRKGVFRKKDGTIVVKTSSCLVHLREKA